jgi:hypothetical protein
LFYQQLFYIYGYLIALLTKFAVSRTREFQVDTDSLITKNPQGLRDAFKKRFQAILQVINKQFHKFASQIF